MWIAKETSTLFFGLFLTVVVSKLALSSPMSATDSIMVEQIQNERLALEQAREWANYSQRLEEIACYQKFFVNVCLEESKERFRNKMAELHKREINNRQAQRNYEAQQRETKKLQDALDREAKQPEEALRRVENRTIYQRKLEEAERRLKEKNSRQKQLERDQNVYKYQQKQQDAVQRKEALEKQNQEKKSQSKSLTDPLPLPDSGIPSDK